MSLAVTRMTALPSELLIEIFYLVCAVDTYDIEQKLHLAQVCAYWRIIALDYPTFWARISLRTSRDAFRLPAALAYSGKVALDVQLRWEDRPHDLIMSDAEQRAVIDALRQSSRLKRLYVQYDARTPQSLLILLGTGLEFPVLEDLEIRGPTRWAKPYLTVQFIAPSLRKLVLFRTDLLSSTDALFSPSLEHLQLEVYVVGAPDQLITTILRQCPALRYLEWDFPSSTPLMTSSDMNQHALVSYLDTLHLGPDVHATDLLRFFNHHRAHVNPIQNITATLFLFNGQHVDHETLELLQEMFFEMGALVDLRVERSNQQITVRDDVGRVRRLHVWGNDLIWNLNSLWSTLSTHYSIDTSLQSLRLQTDEWNGFVAGFSKQSPIALTEVYITITGYIGYDRFACGTWDLDTESRPFRILCIPNLRRIVFMQNTDRDEEDAVGSQSVAIVTRAREILQRIECEASTRVEVCISDAVVALGEEMPTQERLLGGLSDKWVLCTHCDSVLVYRTLQIVQHTRSRA